MGGSRATRAGSFVKIAIDIRHLAAPARSGVGQYTVELISAMANASPDDEFFLFASGTTRALRYLPTFAQTNVHVISQRIPNKLISSLLLTKLRALEDFLPVRPDIWLFPNINLIHTRLPYVITAHDLSWKIYPEFFTRKTLLWHRICNPEKLYQNAKRVIAVSENTKRDVEALIFGRVGTRLQLVVAPHGVNERYRSNKQPSDHQFLKAHGITFPYFLTLSTLEPRKNIESVIEAYDAWRKSQTRPQPAPHLVVAGAPGWKTRSIFETARAAWFRQDIHFLNYVPEAHKPALYRHAEAFLFPSFYEGFGLPVLEAMACGTPVVASFAGALPEIVGNDGILVDPYNVNDLEQAMGIVSQRVEKSKGRKVTEFSWDKAAKITLDALLQ